MSEKAEQEVHDLFERWSDASSAKDIDGAMLPVATDVVSYEHIDRLQHTGVDAVRVVCQQGFDAAQGELRWDVPDLRILVRDDIAATWGMNRVRVIDEDGHTRDHYSRGTRIFQRANGAWKMIHQHVSYPIDPQTGLAKSELLP